MGGEQDAIRFRVVTDIARIRTAVGETVMRVQLDPMTVISVVDIVTKGVLPTSPHIRFLTLKPRVGPIVIKTHRFRNPHGVHEDSLALTHRASRADYPVAHLRGTPYARFTRGESAVAAERVRGKAVVPRDNI